jgi:glycosyltransferase involved in cell wall biosynthesis
LDALFLASHAGKNYFLTHYPEFSSRYQTSHLGVPDPGCVSRASDDNVFRIVSCSNVVPIKRLNLLLNGIALAARLRPDQKFEWIHFGGGKGLQALEKGIYRNFPQNVTGRLLGYLPNEEIMRYYKDNPVDVFVNVSKSEGGSPVSIQEAISCGIPVVAASVGGNPEIVSEKNGILLSPNPTPREIALALLQLWDNPQLTAKMRKESRRIWQEEYNAERNFHAFAERLKAIWES